MRTRLFAIVLLGIIWAGFTLTAVAQTDSGQFNGKPMFITLPPDKNAAAAVAQPNPNASVTTVPVWSSSLSFHGQVYPYTMVGTSPFEGSATTRVPVTIVPLKVIFADGTAFDGESKISATVHSPLFQAADFPSGHSQYNDIIQRAEFASAVESKSPEYHLFLDGPSVVPQITIRIPAAKGQVIHFQNFTFGIMDINNLVEQLNNLLSMGKLPLDPRRVLSVFVYNVFEYSGNPNNCCIIGFHTAFSTSPSSVQTFVYTAYNDLGIFGGNFGDITAFSHELAELVNDPFVNNVVPPWGFPTSPSVCFSNILEVGDPIEVFANLAFGVQLNGTEYHPQDVAFIWWFDHQEPSQGINGQYSYIAPPKLKRPPRPCH